MRHRFVARRYIHGQVVHGVQDVVGQHQAEQGSIHVAANQYYMSDPRVAHALGTPSPASAEVTTRVPAL